MKKKWPTFRIGDVMTNPKLLGPYFLGPSWDTWRSVLKATFAEPMTEAEAAIFSTVAGGRGPPQQRVSEAVFAVGRSGGKDSVASLIATCIAINFDPKGKLRPGERVVIFCIAVDRDQAKLVLNYIKGYFEKVPALAKLVASFDREGISLCNGVDIVVATNSYRSIRGRSILAAIFDEVAFWRDEELAIPDVEVAAAVAPGLARISGSMLILISTVHRRSGLLYNRFRTYFGKSNDDTLVVLGTTQQFNPTFNVATVDRQVAEDPPRFNAEYNGVWRDDLAGFLSRDLIEAAVDRSVVVRPPGVDVRYYGFVDVSGGRRDSFTLGIAHHNRTDDIQVLDAIYERRAPFNPSEVTAEVAALLKSYRIQYVTGDNVAQEWVVEQFRKVGITYRKSNLDRSALYVNCLPLFTSGRVRLLDNPRMVSQFAALERRTFSTGRERIDHPTNGQDDVCNAVAGALVLAAREGGRTPHEGRRRDLQPVRRPDQRRDRTAVPDRG